MKKKIDPRAIGTWLIGLVVAAAVAAGGAGLIYGFSTNNLQDCKSLDGVKYCSDVVIEHYLTYLEVLPWTLVCALGAWTIIYTGYRLTDGPRRW